MENTKLVQEFGVNLIDNELIIRFEKLIGQKAHVFLKRGIFCGHRDFNNILDLIEKKKPFYIYTGRGPSSQSLHLGHLIVLEFTKYLQDVLNVPVIIQMTDDEKYLKNDKTLEEIKEYTNENIKDLIAIGFNPNKTFIFQNTEYISNLYPTILKLQKNCNISEVKSSFGISLSDKMGTICFPLNQAAPAISSSFPGILENKMQCLIPCALDQDVYFRITRDICQRINESKPCLILSTFLPDLRGPKKYETIKLSDNKNSTKSLAELSKMSSTNNVDTNPAVIFLNYSNKQIENIINKHAFSGGKETIEEHRKYGGDINMDMTIRYLQFFYKDDERLEEIKNEYKSGELLSGEIKQILIKTLQEKIENFQNNRSKIDNELIKKFKSIRRIIN